MFCRETIGSLRQVAAQNPDFPPVLFFYMGTAQRGQAYFAERWPEARGVADPQRRFYNAFGVGQGSLRQTMSPQVVLAGLNTMAAGYSQGKTEGDVWQMPGMFLVQGERVLWQHDYAHVGDHPDFEKIPEIASRI
jgi:hypothetical protein